MADRRGQDKWAGDISALVFRRVMREDAGEISFDPKMLAVFMDLDGKKSLAAVAKNTGHTMGSLRESVGKLLRLKLIEPVAGAISLVDRDFLDRVNQELSLVIGPLAEIVMEDAAADLGHDLSRLPTRRAAELVELIAREIKREDKRAAFVQTMVSVLKEKGY
jgi:hypothetical protein